MAGLSNRLRSLDDVVVTAVLRWLRADAPAATVADGHLTGRLRRLDDRALSLLVAWLQPGQPLAPGSGPTAAPSTALLGSDNTVSGVWRVT